MTRPDTGLHPAGAPVQLLLPGAGHTVVGRENRVEPTEAITA